MEQNVSIEKLEYPLELRRKFVVGALFKQNGYTDYSAISDIIDNSMEPCVGTENLYIYLKKQGKEVNAIHIVDDGCGMDIATLKEALAMGSETGKNPEENLGCYGGGMKCAALSLGNCLKVLTKEENGPLISGIIDLNNSYENAVKVVVGPADESDNKFFEEYVQASHGTIISITDLTLKSNAYDYFPKQLETKISENFYYFISNDDKEVPWETKNFFIGECPEKRHRIIGHNAAGIDVIPGCKTLVSNKTVETEFGNFTYNAYFIPRLPDNSEASQTYTRTSANSGIYVYRQKRLVGRALNLGLMTRSKTGAGYKDTWFNGLRIEMFMDGNCDKAFNTTYTKMLNESDGANLSKSFRDKVFEEFKAVRSATKTLESAYSDNDVDDAGKNKLKDIFNNRAKKINGNTLYKIDRKGTKKLSDGTKPEEEEEKGSTGHGGRKPGIPNKEKKPFEMEYFRGGEYGFVYEYTLNNNVPVIRLNIDHKFYKCFLSKYTEENAEVLDMICTLLITYTTAQQQLSNNEDTEKIFDAYNGTVSRLLSTEIEFDPRDY